MNDHSYRRVLIYDEAGFSRVCSAILAIEGFGTDIMDEHHNIPELINRNEVGVFVTSYPYGALLLDEVRKRSIPAIVLYDNLDERFINTVLKQENLYCMIKPLDYTKFKSLVKSLLSGKQVSREEYGIV
jgi:DNA-binding NtrC family response regulator